MFLQNLAEAGIKHPDDYLGELFFCGFCGCWRQDKLVSVH